MSRQRNFAWLLTGLAVVAALAVSSTVAGAKGGKPGGETLGNNLSIPAVFVPSTAGAPVLRLPCPATPTDPSGSMSPQFPDYWLQKTEAVWSAGCQTALGATVTADWGDNLTRAVSLAAGKPIRVEVSLLTTTEMTGFVVTNLTPELPDNQATYGTDGTVRPAAANDTRVWDSGARLHIERLSDGTVVFDGPMSAEINSLGGVVYGFNWGIKGRKNVPALGEYSLTFTTSGAVTIEGIADAGKANEPTWSDHETTVTVEIVGGNPGGGGGGHNGGGGGGHN